MQTSFDLYAVSAVFVLLAVIVLFKVVRKPKENKNQAGNGKVGPLSRERIIEMNNLVTNYLIQNKPFLQQRYSIAQMSGDLQIPQHHLSAFINSYYKVNFNDLINKYRVYYSKVMMINEEWKHKTLQVIALESGFVKELKNEGVNRSLHINRIKEDCMQKCPEMKFMFVSIAS